MKLKSMICMLFGLAGLVSAAEEATYYVAPNGNDASSGTLAQPLATLNGARLKVRQEIAKGLNQPVTALIRGGEYTLDKTVVFSHEDSGTEKCPITYRAYPDEKPVFTGGIKLSGWKPCTQNPAGLPSVAKGKLWVCDIPVELKGKWRITSLYDGVTMLPRSESGELKVAPTRVVDDLNAQPKNIASKLTRDREPITFTRTFIYQNDDLRAWPNVNDIEIFISPKHGWLVNMLPLAKIDPATKTATFAVDSTYQVKNKDVYHVQNAIDYLDQEGEWVYNSNEGRIYIWPKRPLAQSDIRAPFLQEFIRVEGVEDGIPARFVHFKGLTFHHGLRDTWREGDIGLQHDWEMYDKGNAVLRFRHAEDCSVDECAFTASSGSGVRLDLHCQRITVGSSLFAHLGGTGILLNGYGAGTKDENHHNTVTNNYIHHIGEIYWHSPAIFIAQSGHNLISHNTIHDLSYNGMVISGIRPHELMYHKPLANRREWIRSLRLAECQPYIDKLFKQNAPTWRQFNMNEILPLLHSGENRIEYNDISRVMLRLHDGNAIYLSCMGINNHIVRNYIHDFGSDRSTPMRLDDNSTFTYFENNVFVGSKKGIGFKAPAEVRNNFFIDVDDASIGPKPFLRDGEHVVYDANMVYNVPEDGEGKVRVFWHSFKDKKGVYRNCLLFSEPAPKNVKPGDELIAAEFRGDAKVGVLFADPMLDREAMKKRIYRFKPGSPVGKLGIKPIDLSHVGSTLAP